VSRYINIIPVPLTVWEYCYWRNVINVQRSFPINVTVKLLNSWLSKLKGLGGDTNDAKKQDFTIVGYYFCDEPIPYRTTILGRNVTLGQLKQLIAKKGNYRWMDMETRVLHWSSVAFSTSVSLFKQITVVLNVSAEIKNMILHLLYLKEIDSAYTLPKSFRHVSK